MEQRDEWSDNSEGIFEDGKEVWHHPPDIDARTAAWVTMVSPQAAAMYLGTGLSLPEEPPYKPGTGEGWQDRAVGDVLSECYARGMLDPNREMVEEVAISMMPLPTSAMEMDIDEDRRTTFGPSPIVRWEIAVSEVSRKVAGFLKYGPSARFTGSPEGDILVGGRDIISESYGMRLCQRVALLWRHGDGSIECIIVVEEPDEGIPPCEPAEDWRVILATDIIFSEFGRIPLVHLVRVQAGVAQVVKPPHGHITNSILRLARAVREAKVTSDNDIQNGFTYPISSDSIYSLQRGDWPGGRPGYPGARRPGR